MSLPGCVEEVDLERESILDVKPKEIITTNLRGTIFDENDQVVEQAEVQIKTAEGWQQVRTDEFGQFEFLDVRVKGASAFIKVSSPGKFEAFRRADVIRNKNNYTELKLLERTIVGTINASAGGEVSTSSGAAVRLPANGVVTQNGQAYTGNISVAMQWIDPTADDLHQRLVGDLSGIDIEGNEVVLGTFGMMNVELLDDQGNELQLAEEARAELTWPVPLERLRDAPQSIPVWSYDENLGTWIEEEVATQNGNIFTGEVSHFSSWNLDWKGPSITLNGQVTYNGNPGDILSAFRVDVSSPVFGSRGGFLTTDGEFQFLRFPADEVFDFTIKNICGEAVYEETYGPFSQNTDLGVIDISAPVEETSVTGVAVDCDNNPIEGAIVELETNSNRYFIEETGSDGRFEFTVPFCGSSTTAEVSIVDPEQGLVSAPQTIAITSTGQMDLGNIRVCDQAAVFFQLNIDTFDLFFAPPQGTPFFVRDQSGTSTVGLEGNENAIIIRVDEMISDTGSYESSTHSFYLFDLFVAGPQTVYTNYSPPDLNIEITEYSDIPGEFLGGNLSGSVSSDSTGMGTPVPISGAFRIEVR